MSRVRHNSGERRSGMSGTPFQHEHTLVGIVDLSRGRGGVLNMT